jgi:hypothetical protein
MVMFVPSEAQTLRANQGELTQGSGLVHHGHRSTPRLSSQVCYVCFRLFGLVGKVFGRAISRI